MNNVNVILTPETVIGQNVKCIIGKSWHMVDVLDSRVNANGKTLYLVELQEIVKPHGAAYLENGVLRCVAIAGVGYIGYTHEKAKQSLGFYDPGYSGEKSDMFGLEDLR